MRSTEGYKTRQRAAVETVLRSTEAHVTADEIVELLAKSGQAVGRTTVYRCLERLVEEGQVRKYAAASGESACYQYIHAGHDCREHFHLKCTACGKLIHIECDHMSELSAHIDGEHGFSVDPLKTVLYGLCKDCRVK
ncbi:MAG: transcriptional repressor [Clostridia bacterium]|nr:transcriptional repressor [Clostridia bacterium]